MQKQDNLNSTENATILSHAFLSTTTAGTLAVPPMGTAEEAASTLDQQIDDCVATLRGMLARMHPDAKVRTQHAFGNGRDHSIIFSVEHPYQPPKGVLARDWIRWMEGCEA